MRTLDTSEAGLIELVGDAPRWIWAFTCPTPGCDCRTAIVLSTGGDRQTLVARGSPVRDAWLRGESRAKAAAALDGIAAFAIDIDEGCVFPAYGEDPFAPFDLGAHPDASHVVDRIDGEILETLGRLWYRGKGWPDPEERSREAQQIKVEDWKRGDLVAWAEALVGVRQDILRRGGLLLRRGGARLRAGRPAWCAGSRSGSRGQVRPSLPRTEHERHRERLEQLWAAFQSRHPRHRERFALRSTVMQGLAGRIVGAPRGGIERRTAKVGRNDPCPCGSGKKYKKCCGVT
jgi:hypothetical protein